MSWLIRRCCKRCGKWEAKKYLINGKWIKTKIVICRRCGGAFCTEHFPADDNICLGCAIALDEEYFRRQ